MNWWQAIKILGREPKAYVKRWRKNLEILYKYPDVSQNFPVFWFYDSLDSIEIGNQVYIGQCCEIFVVKNSPFTKISGRLIIRDRVVIGAFANIRAAGGEIAIGRDTILAQNVSLIASDHTISNEKPYRDLPWNESKIGIVIEENVWIGAGVTVLPGCVIGKNSVIGAGSVVTKSVPPNEVWAGIPARKLKSIVELKETEIRNTFPDVKPGSISTQNGAVSPTLTRF